MMIHYIWSNLPRRGCGDRLSTATQDLEPFRPRRGNRAARLARGRPAPAYTADRATAADRSGHEGRLLRGACRRRRSNRLLGHSLRRPHRRRGQRSHDSFGATRCWCSGGTLRREPQCLSYENAIRVLDAIPLRQLAMVDAEAKGDGIKRVATGHAIAALRSASGSLCRARRRSCRARAALLAARGLLLDRSRRLACAPGEQEAARERCRK